MLALSVLIVAGNPNLGSLLGWHLQQVGCTVYHARGEQQALALYLKHRPSLVTIDTDLTDGDALHLCRRLYEDRRSLLLLLSTKTSEMDKVCGLKAGADDYLTKPFGMQEFLARVEAIGRRLRLATTPVTRLDYGSLQIDLVQRQVKIKDTLVNLTPQEFSLLVVLAQAEGAAVTRNELLARAWPEDIDNPRTVDTHVLSLRKKIELAPQQPNLIQTVRNVGYRLNLEALLRPSPPRPAMPGFRHQPNYDRPQMSPR